MGKPHLHVTLPVLKYRHQDALELSDDSDIEVHPNVDKRSFIRAKQNQIHQDRSQRKLEIETLKYERIINDGLLSRIDRLLSALKSHASHASTDSSSSTSESTARGSSPDELVFQSLIESAGSPAEDQPPPPPEGVHTNVQEQPSYSKMMAALVDQVKKTVDEQKDQKSADNDSERLGGYVEEVRGHKSKVLDLQQQLLKRLAELEKLEGSKITSESIHTGFNTSHVSKAQAAAQATKENAPSKSSSAQLLNPGSSSPFTAQANAELSSGSEADTEDNNPDPSLSSPIPDRTVHPSKLGMQFSSLPPNAYSQYLSFISANPTVLAERETDGLLMRSFDLQYAGQEAQSRHAVHQALLLQYCRSLGPDGVNLFFRRVTTPGHQAHKMFSDDVNSTYARLRTRAKEMASEAKEDGDDEGAEGEGVEQIQLHAVHPGQRIQIGIPPALAQCTTDEERKGREAFDTFPPGLQRALESGELDEVNKVLGRMSVEEAEEVVGKLGEGGMLSLEEGVVDATTEQGREFLKEMEGGVEGEPGGAETGGRIEEMEEDEGVKAVDVVD